MTGVCRAIHVLLLLGIITSVQITASHETKLVGEKTDACAGPSSSPLSVFIALKTTTASSVYTSRASVILNTWGSNALGNLAFITDGIVTRRNVEFTKLYPSLPIIEIKGSEKFGQYRNGPRNRYIGYASQRVKVRSTIKWFHDNVRSNSGIEWLCYIDDDMYVNVANLNAELSRVLASPPDTCSRIDRCVIADAGPITFHSSNMTVIYSNAVWCMTLPTLKSVNELLLSKTDDQLGWIGDSGTDDVGFALVLQRHLNITITNSLTMCSINSRIAVSPPDRKVNPVGTYTMRKVNLRGDKDEFNFLQKHKAPSDVLARMSVLNLPVVNYTDLCERHGAHKMPYGTSPRLIVDMKQWDAYVDPVPTCRQPLNATLTLATTSSFVLQYKL